MSFNPPPNGPRPPAGWSPPAKQPWHQRTVFVVLFLIFFFPVGLVLLWLRRDWSVRRRGIVTAVIGVVVLFAAVNSNPPPTTTTVLSPTAASGTATTASPSPVPASSQAATPSLVATTSPAPVTSAPPKTTAAAAPVRTSAAPVRTTAAPVHTTKAPQPVQTTAQRQGCYPRSSSGNCYRAGEFCSTADHYLVGTDANGNKIECEPDGKYWRWERV